MTDVLLEYLQTSPAFRGTIDPEIRSVVDARSRDQTAFQPNRPGFPHRAVKSTKESVKNRLLALDEMRNFDILS